MKILPEPVEFEWDKGNVDKNWAKHKVAVQEIEQVFYGEESFIFEDAKHSTTEKRYALFGKTEQGRTLSIVFTIRREKVRVIMARNMSRKERRDYEKIKINSKV